uniref:Phage protein n=1 Tax=Meloidogyne hapla TaxID=6305 RepID=A0A1I8B1P6_MELHA
MSGYIGREDVICMLLNANKKYIDKAIDDSKYSIPVEFMTPELEKEPET